ncbi:MAG: hypothetical protein CME58_03960 [Halieaceae bacterium]|nr:hypothetical protein [Halieaceae bacterium]
MMTQITEEQDIQELYQSILAGGSWSAGTDDNSAATRLFLEKYRVSIGKRYVLGCTKYARHCIETLDCDYVIDDLKTPGSFSGKQVVSLDAVPDDGLVISCAMFQAQTVKRKLDCRAILNTDYYCLMIQRPELQLPLLEYWVGDEPPIADYSVFMSELEDDESQETLCKILAFRASGNLRYMGGFSNRLEEMYFEPFLRLPQDPVFYDVGALNGENSIGFAERYPSYVEVVAFEPMHASFNKLSSNLRAYDRVQCVRAAVTDSVGNVSFYEDAFLDAAASLEPRRYSKQVIVPAVTIDAIRAERCVPVSLIKMDIEGAEIQALSGAKQTIKVDMPNLAVSVYHHPAHILDAWKKIKNYNCNYRFFLRHYSEGFAETVLYAIPSH